jgi:hypothetical protein
MLSIILHGHLNLVITKPYVLTVMFSQMHFLSQLSLVNSPAKVGNSLNHA